MFLMEKDGQKKYVPDAFVEKYRSDGYHVVGEDRTEQSSPDPASVSDPENTVIDEPETESATEPVDEPADEPETESTTVTAPEKTIRKKAAAKGGK